MLLATIASACFAGFHYTRPQRLAKMASQYLTTITGADVVVGSARVDLHGLIHLRDITITLADPLGGDGRFFAASQIVVRHDMSSLLRGRFAAKSITLFEPTLFITEDAASRKFNYETLRHRSSGSDSGAGAAMPQSLPEVHIDHGRVIFREQDGTEYRKLGDLSLGGAMREDMTARGRYEFLFHQELAGSTQGTALRGSLDLNTLDVRAELEGFALDAPQRNVLPHRLREWWDLLEPTGSLPIVQVGYRSAPERGFYARLDVRDVKLTLPYTESAARMTVQQGRFILANDRVKVEDLAGLIEGFRYVINGEINGFDETAPFALSAHILGAIPEQPRYLPWFPENVQRAFNRFAPSGEFRANVLVRRAAPADKLTYEGRVGIRNATLRYFRYPYTLSDVSGELLFNGERLTVERLTGRGDTGSTLTIHGIVEPVADDAGVKMTVSSPALKLDEVFRAAIVNDQDVYDALFDGKTYKRLTDPESGLLISSAQKAQWGGELEALQTRQYALRAAKSEDAATLDAAIQVLKQRLARPLFDLGGVAACTAVAERPVGPNEKYSNNIKFGVNGVNLLLDAWPYPLKLTDGQFFIRPDSVDIKDVKLVGVHGGTATITGKYTKQTFGDRRKLVPNIEFHGSNFPIDDLLIASMPAEQQKMLTDLRLTGYFDLAGILLPDPVTGDTAYRIVVRLHDGTSTPFGGQFVIEGLQGDLTIRDGKVNIESITGKRGDSTIELTGSLAWGGLGKSGGPAATDASGGELLKVKAQRLRFDDAIADLLPPDAGAAATVRKLFADLKPQGEFGAEATFRTSASASDYQMQILPSQFSFLLRGRRVAFTDIKGDVQVSPTGIRTAGCEASFNSGKLRLSGEVAMNDGAPTYAIQFELANREFCEVTRALLPAGVLSAIEGIRLAGAYRIHDASLVRMLDDKGTASVDLKAKVALTDCTADLGVAVTELNGELTVQASQQGDEADAVIQVDLAADHVRVTDRVISPLTLRMFNRASDPKVLWISDVRGTCYGGSLVGSGKIDMGTDSRYAFDMTLHDARLQGMIDPRPDAGDVKRKVPRTDGLLSANLSIAGVPNNAATREGRGELRIHDANLYELPLTMVMLQLLNFSPPTARAFDTATAAYLLSGDLVRIEDIKFESQTIDIVGSGTMRYSTLGLDLQMHTRNRASPRLGPVSDLIRVFKDELATIHVTGTLNEPKARLVSLGGIQKSIRDVVIPQAPVGGDNTSGQ